MSRGWKPTEEQKRAYRKQQKEHYERNREEILRKRAAAYAANVDRRKAQAKASYQRNRDKNLRRATEYRKKNPKKLLAYQLEYRKKYPEKTKAWARKANRKSKLKKHYSLTLEAFDGFLKAQGGCCAVCKTTTPTRQGWHVDHHHDTGTVRGVLCGRCNCLLGNAKERIETLLAAIEYLSSRISGIRSTS